MWFELELFDRARCSKRSKVSEGIIPLTKTLISFSERARREGLLALEDDLEEVEDPFLREAIQLVVDGTDPEIIEEILRSKMLAPELKGASLLKRMICTAGTLSIQAGDNPRVLALKLAGYLEEPELRSAVLEADEDLVFE